MFNPTWPLSIQCNSQSFADSDHVHFVVHILTVQIVFSNLLSPMTSHYVNVSRTVLFGLPVIHQTYIHHPKLLLSKSNSLDQLL